MVKYVSLKDLIGSECDLPSWENAQVAVDSNVLKFRLHDLEDYNFTLTSGVIKESEKMTHLVPKEVIRDFATATNPEIYCEMVSPEDEREIKRAVVKRRKAEYRKNGEIGWVDMQQIGYAMERARQGKRTIIISNDRDISGAIRGLREKFEHLRDKVSCVSIHNYLKKKYDTENGLEGAYLRILFRNITNSYSHVAA